MKAKFFDGTVTVEAVWVWWPWQTWVAVIGVLVIVGLLLWVWGRK